MPLPCAARVRALGVFQDVVMVGHGNVRNNGGKGAVCICRALK